MVCYMLWPLETLALFVYRTCVQPQNSKEEKLKDGHVYALFKLDKWRANLVLCHLRTCFCYICFYPIWYVMGKTRGNQITIKRQSQSFNLSNAIPKMKFWIFQPRALDSSNSLWSFLHGFQVNGLFKVLPWVFFRSLVIVLFENHNNLFRIL